MKKVVFETVGTGHYLDNYRCGGSKPWGGGEVTHRAELSAKDIITALEGTQHGRAALSDYVKRQASVNAEPKEALGRAIDTVDNFAHALSIPMPAQIHVSALSAGLPSAVADLKGAYVALTGENPWGN